ncbi:DoxX family protein [Actinoplanes sp. NPDC020271]|uniref:DoxX family protein n=1 Tax=Actinoplanes sp. NPDC020271 TaxID=3363896 RepID=UPI0037A11020
MNIVLWIVAGVLAVAFTVGGLSQLLMAKDRYRAFGPSQRWVDDFSAAHLKAIGTIKTIGAVALLVPVLTPLAACGLALFMAGAVTTRLRRSEWSYLLGDLCYLGLFVFLAWGRFDLQPLT